MFIPVGIATTDAAALVGAAAAAAGAFGVVLQLRGAAAVGRAQATMQFQQIFKSSAEARGRLQRTFPVHVDVLKSLNAQGAAPQWRTWEVLGDLTNAERADATAVVNALNDVAQYVTDGLPLRSALQQYHAVFIRAGFLLCPYVDQLNSPDENGRPSRVGRRIPILYNAALHYHRFNSIHQARRILIERDAADGSGRTALDLCGGTYELRPHAGFPDDPYPRRLREPSSLSAALRACERQLRR